MELRHRVKEAVYRYINEVIFGQPSTLVKLVDEMKQRPVTVETRMKPPTMYRQGDVLLVKVNQMRNARDVTPKDRIVLAYGEVTGHAHAVYPQVITKDKPPALPAKLWDAGAERYLQVIERTALKHEEHDAITLAPGLYRVIRQREFDPRIHNLSRWVED